MLKWLFFAVIIMSGGGIGYELRRKMLCRTRSLEMFRDFLSYARSNIVYSRLALHDIIEEYHALHVGDSFFIKFLSEANDNSFDCAWRNSVIGMSKVMCLTGDDERFLCNVGEKIGRADADCETEHLSFVISELNHMIEQSKRDVTVDGKICLTTSISAAFIVALIVI